jgi:hypothetical protein
MSLSLFLAMSGKLEQHLEEVDTNRIISRFPSSRRFPSYRTGNMVGFARHDDAIPVSV